MWDILVTMLPVLVVADMYIELLEEKPRTEKDRQNLKEAAALNRKIGKHLSDLKKISP